MDGFQGALLNVKLPHLARWTARRQAIAQRYLDGLRLADLRLPDQPAYGRSVFHQFTVRHPRRDALRAHLTACDVGTDLIYPVPLHRQKCYADLGYAEGSLPVAERAAATCVSLPIFPELTDAQVDHVIASVTPSGARFRGRSGNRSRSRNRSRSPDRTRPARHANRDGASKGGERVVDPPLSVTPSSHPVFCGKAFPVPAISRGP